MNRAPLVLVSSSLFFAFGAAALACGGAKESDLFAPPGSSQLGTEPSPAASDGPSASAPSTSSGGSSTSTSSSSGGSSSSGSSSGGSSSGGSSSGGSSSGGSSGGSSSGGSSGTSWKSPGIYCGEDDATGNDKFCSPGTQLCCATAWGTGTIDFACSPSGPIACAGSTPIRCDDRTDCPAGQVCCGAFDPNLGYRSVQCQTACTSTIPQTISVQLCDPNAPVDECLNGKDCTTSNSLPGFHYCK